MEGYRPATYGDGFADVYDDWYADLGDPEVTAERIAELANDGAVLELGVGTGRLASPMVVRGIPVVGVDVSAPMLSRLASRPRDQTAVRMARADMSFLPFAPASFTVVLAAYNVLFNLPDELSQSRCMRDARRVLRPGGVVVIETFVPPDDEPRGGLDVRDVTIDSVVLTASRLEPSDHTISGQHIEIRESGIRMRPWFLHYLQLDELDEMACAAGLALESRWSDWHGRQFTDRADEQISVYRAV